MIALEKPKEMVTAAPRHDGERVNPKAALQVALKKYPRTMAYLAR